MPGAYLVAEYGIVLLWITGFVRDAIEGYPSHMLFAAANIALLAYGIGAFIGVRESLEDFWSAVHGLADSAVGRALGTRLR